MGVLDGNTYDDGATGDGLGLGLADSADGYTGADDYGDGSQGSPYLGSSVALDYTDGESDFSIDDFIDYPGAELASLNLTGATDPAPSTMGDLGLSHSGGGFAPPSAATTTPKPGDAYNTALGALAKFGVSFASLLSNSGYTSEVPAADPNANRNPNISPVFTISKTHSLLVVAVIGGVMLFLLLGEN